MKEFWESHKVFVSVTGGGILLALVLLLGVAMPMRSAAGEANDEAKTLQTGIRASEGNALSASAKSALEEEVKGLEAHVAQMEKMLKASAEDAGSDPVLVYGRKLEALRKSLESASQKEGIAVPDNLGFPEPVAPEDVEELLPIIDVAQKVLAKAIVAGAKRVELVNAGPAAGEWFGEDMQVVGPVKRTVVVVEVKGPVDAMVALLHSLQKKDGLLAIARVRLAREKPESPEATLRIAAGSITIGDAGTGEEASSGGGNDVWIPGR